MIKRILLLPAALALLCLLSACFPEPPPEVEPEEPQSEKIYYTLRLVNDNSDTIGISVGGSVSDRALTGDVTEASYEYLEVVFYYNGSNTATGHRVARTTWNAGEAPEIGGVYGKGAGEPAVDYRSVRAPASGTGAAVLFAGTKEDKTLLAVGRLSHVDNQPAGDTNMVGPNTTAVTFEVTALKAGTKFSAQRAGSAFFTSCGAGANSHLETNVSETNTTILDNVFINDADKKFPLYMLNRQPGNSITKGRYAFKMASGSFDDYAGNDGGIVLAGGWNCEVTDPRYGSVSPQGLGLGTNVMNNNIQPGNYVNAAYSNTAYFQNPVTFTFDTTSSPDGAVFALAFEIFVYNLTPRLTTMSGWENIDPVTWRISPGTGGKWLDLDDGSGGEGGAILLGCGSVSVP